MRYGVCADPAVAPAIAKAGFTFIELNVQKYLKPQLDVAEFRAELTRIQASPLPALAGNVFLPGSLKITGPDVDWAALEAYVTTAFDRAQLTGMQTIVFGSGGARRIPEGFDRDAAWEQLLRFGAMMGPIAEEKGITVAVEPLNTNESNVLTSVAEAASYVRQVGHRNVRLLVDAYHWAVDYDNFDDIVANGDLLHHVHVATAAHRQPPGFEPADFDEFFRALRLAHYDGPVSIEATWDDIEAQASQAYEALVALAEGAEDTSAGTG